MKYPQLVSMPSAVSDWLEEQLEARGIDAVVYTRYVLSLLYCRDPVDIICPDQDLHFTNPQKEVRRSSSGGGGSRKRFCRSHDYADADQLKRLAAVECLKSASDQKCGIESLVDELCAKLEEIQSPKRKESADAIKDPSESTQATTNKVSLQDSTKRYYAAFPALSTTRNLTASSQAQKLRSTLIPKWVGSPKRRIAKKLNSSRSFSGNVANCHHLKVSSSAAVGKSRFQAAANIRHHKNKDMMFGAAHQGNSNRRASRSLSDWEYYTTRSNDGDDGMIGTKIDEELKLDKDDGFDESMYEDLPVDIRDLLESPRRDMKDVGMMNLANMRDTSNEKQFIQCGTNIISSIWSAHTPMDEEPAKTGPYTFFDLIDCIDHSVWSSMQNEANSLLEDAAAKYAWNNVVTDRYKLEKWSEATCECGPMLPDIDDDGDEGVVSKSLMKINHSKEKSCFKEITPRDRTFPLDLPRSMPRKSYSGAETKSSKEDLLHSIYSHFRPINEKPMTDCSASKKTTTYADGTTFAIPSALETIEFKRSESGIMFLDAECGKPKKYLEFERANGNLMLKFNLKQNDKACQTEEYDDGSSMLNDEVSDTEFYFPGDDELLELEKKAWHDDGDGEIDATAAERAWSKRGDATAEVVEVDVSASQRKQAWLDNDDKIGASQDYSQDDVDSMMAELFGKEAKCDKCNEVDWWAGKTQNASDENNIWNGGEICLNCLKSSNGGDDRPEQHNQLREDITQDGEQLLMDLSSLQKSYMEELPPNEISCDLNELIAGNKWSRSAGLVAISSGSAFSFATRLQQDCLIKMTTIPTLRSVTL